jgi:hypothetical protein
MKQTIFALAAATLVAAALPSSADARCYGCAVGAGAAATRVAAASAKMVCFMGPSGR